MLDEINIVWFKRDLRITDHLPIYIASKESIPFIPLYVLDQNYWSQGFSSRTYNGIKGILSLEAI